MKILDWLEHRLPVTNAFRKHLSQYPIPKNINIWYVFGALSLVLLVNQFLTGIFLAMHYVPTAEQAFSSIEVIMREVDFGWLLRYLHSTGASALFFVLYLHIFRGLIYGSYQQPRELVWLLGMVSFLVIMAIAFTGYLLPWGNMSYWGAQVILSIFNAIPVVGDDLANWIRGGEFLSGTTLNRFFILHVVVLPFLLFLIAALHLLALHQVGSNNPDGIETKSLKTAKNITPVLDEKVAFKFHSDFTRDYVIRDSVPFYPYGLLKDLKYIVLFLIVFCFIVFFYPTMGGYFLEADNFMMADPMQTPEHIAPVWYFTPFYAILRAIPDKQLGVLAMGLSIFLLFIIPWLDRCQVRSFRYRSRWHLLNLVQFSMCFIGLGILGGITVTPATTILTRVLVFGYFAFFICLFVCSKYEKTLPLPKRVRM